MDYNSNTFLNFPSSGGGVTVNSSNSQIPGNIPAFEGSNSLISSSIWVSGSNLGINTSSPIYPIDILSTSAMRLPVGTTAERPIASNDGIIRYNTTLSNFEGYSNNTWGLLAGSSSSTTYTGTVPVSQSNISNPYRFRAYGSAGDTIATATYKKYRFNMETYDTNNNFDATTNYRYTAPVAGVYHVSAQVLFGTLVTANQSYRIAIYKNGTIYSEHIVTNGSQTDYVGTNICDTVELAVSDYLEIYCYHTAGNTVNFLQYVEHSHFRVHLIAPTTPTNISVSVVGGTGTISPTILNVSNPYRFRAYLASVQTGIPTGNFTKVLFVNESFDYNNNFNTTNSRYTVAIAGTYAIIAQLTYTSIVANKSYQVAIRKNNVAINYSASMNGNSTGSFSALASEQLVLAVNDYIEIWTYQDSGGTVSLQGEAAGIYTFFNMYLIAPTTPASLTVTF
jgi:hypothetical protein